RRLPASRRERQEEDPRPERRPALRHRGAEGVPDRGLQRAGRPGRLGRCRRQAAGRRFMTSPKGRGAVWTEERRRSDEGRRPPGGPEAKGNRAVLKALETVRDPELDEPITSLGFVASCAVSAAGDAQVRLRLPTY